MNNNSGKALAVILAMVMVVVCAAVIFSENIQAEDATPEKMTGVEFLALDEDGDGVITLTQDIEVTTYVNVTKNLTVNLAGHTLSSSDDVKNIFQNSGESNLGTADVDLTINGTVAGSAINAANRITYFIAANCDLTVTGGTYTAGDFGFIWYGIKSDSYDNTVSISDATVTADGPAFWLSNQPIASAVFTNCNISSNTMGIYLGTVQNTTLKNCTIAVTNSDPDVAGSTVEIKAGDVTIDGCNISSSVYYEADDVGAGTSGGSVSSVTINSAYCGPADVDSVNVSITNSRITNTAADSKAVILTSNTDDAAIALQWEGHDINDVALTGTAAGTEGSITVAENPDRVFSSQITLGDGAVVDASTSIIASKTQEVIVTGDATVVKGGILDIFGKLTIEDGASLTLKEGSKVIVRGSGIIDIQGDLVVEAGAYESPTSATENLTADTFTYSGCQMTVAGTVTLEGAKSFQVDGGTGIEISGTFNIEDVATANLDGATVVSGGEVNVYGVISGTVTNNGTITIESEGTVDENGNVTSFISGFKVIMGNGATLNVDNLYGNMTVTDEGMEFTYGGVTNNVENVNTIGLRHVSGVVITENLVIKDNEAKDGKIGDNSMIISGTIDEASMYDGARKTQSSSIIVNGSNVIVSDVVSIESVDLEITGKMTVSGQLTIGGEVVSNNTTTPVTSNDATITLSGQLYVTGTVITNIKPIDGSVVNAAMYEAGTGSSKVYTYTTLENAIASGATKITITGTIDVKSDVDVPVGTTITATEATVNIDENATLTFLAEDRSSSRINGGTINVDGTLVFQNSSRGDNTELIVSDTSKESGDAMTYTNIYKALDEAVDGETVKITKNGTGNEGVTVTLERNVEIKSGVTLEVPAINTLAVADDVTLTVNGNLVVDGKFTISDTPDKEGSTVVNGMMQYITGNYTSQIVGAYFFYDGYETITTLENAASLVNEISDSSIDLYGDMTVGDITFEYTGTSGMDLVAYNKLTAGNITLGTVEFQASTGSVVTGTFTMTNGSVDLDNVTGIQISEQTSVDVDNNTVYTATVSGNVSSYDSDADDDVNEDGSVTIGGEVTSSAIYEQYVTVNVPSGTTLTTTNGSDINTAVVEGTLTANGSTTIGTASVVGTIDSDSVSINIGTLYAGVTVDDKVITVGTGNAVIGDDVSVTGIAYVAPGTTVGENITSLPAKNITEYYVDDSLFVTAYAVTSTPISNIEAPAEHAEFEYWMYDDNGKMTNVEDANVGEYPEVYAYIEYNIYKIDISACPGVSVYIDGKEWNDSTMYSYGQHTITVYVAPSYEGTPAITVNGQTVTNGTFQVTGDTEIVVTGVTASSGQIVIDNGGSDDMSLTDILLIILVILIVVMAIIVALRLMRS